MSVAVRSSEQFRLERSYELKRRQQTVPDPRIVAELHRTSSSLPALDWQCPYRPYTAVTALAVSDRLRATGGGQQNTTEHKVQHLKRRTMLFIFVLDYCRHNDALATCPACVSSTEPAGTGLLKQDMIACPIIRRIREHRNILISFV